jgi:hypothetical protein
MSKHFLARRGTKAPFNPPQTEVGILPFWQLPDVLFWWGRRRKSVHFFINISQTKNSVCGLNMAFFYCLRPQKRGTKSRKTRLPERKGLDCLCSILSPYFYCVTNALSVVFAHVDHTDWYTLIALFVHLTIFYLKYIFKIFMKINLNLEACCLHIWSRWLKLHRITVDGKLTCAHSWVLNRISQQIE